MEFGSFGAFAVIAIIATLVVALLVTFAWMQIYKKEKKVLLGFLYSLLEEMEREQLKNMNVPYVGGDETGLRGELARMRSFLLNEKAKTEKKNK